MTKAVAFLAVGFGAALQLPAGQQGPETANAFEVEPPCLDQLLDGPDAAQIFMGQDPDVSGTTVVDNKASGFVLAECGFRQVSNARCLSDRHDRLKHLVVARGSVFFHPSTKLASHGAPQLALKFTKLSVQITDLS